MWWSILICQVVIVPKTGISMCCFTFPLYFALAAPSLPSPSFQKQILTDVVLYLYTFARLPLPELSSCPILSPSGSCISRGRCSHTSPRYTGAVRQAVQCQHAINILLYYTPDFNWWALPNVYHIHDCWCFLCWLERFCCVVKRVFASACCLVHTYMKLHTDAAWLERSFLSFTHVQLKFECSTCVSVLSRHADLPHPQNGN